MGVHFKELKIATESCAPDENEHEGFGSTSVSSLEWMWDSKDDLSRGQRV